MSTPYDAIVVLGKGMERDNQLTSFGKESTKVAVDLFELGYSGKVIFSGGIGRWNKGRGITEAEAMKDYAKKSGMPGENIYTEAQSRDTVENAGYTKEILERMGAKKVVVVTTDFHIDRAAYIFDRLLGDEFEKPYYVSVESGLKSNEYRSRSRKEKILQGLAKISPRIHLRR